MLLPRYHGNNNTEEEEEEPILLATPNPLQVLIMPSLSFELLSSSSLLLWLLLVVVLVNVGKNHMQDKENQPEQPWETEKQTPYNAEERSDSMKRHANTSIFASTESS